MKKETPLTKEYFDEKLAPLASKKDIDDLALATLKGFAGVDNRFKEVNQKFGKVFERLDNIEQNFAAKTDLYETETRLGDKIDKLDKRFDSIEKYIGSSEVRIMSLNEIVQDHSPRIRTLEKTARI